MTLLAAALAAHALAFPERVAIESPGNIPIEYGRLAAMVLDLSRFLGRRLDPEKPVALRLDHGPVEALLELALLDAGIPVLSLPRFFTDLQASRAIALAGAQAIYDEGLDARPAPRTDGWRNLPPGTARITFTSGSTGTPKGICLSADHMLMVANAVVDRIGRDQAGRHLALLPSGILLETVAGLFATVLAGGTYCAPPQDWAGLAKPFRPDFARMAESIDESCANSLILVPQYLAGLVDELEDSGARLPHLRLVAVGGARTSGALLDRARACGLPVRQGYGLTECASVVALEDGDGSPRGSVGRPLPHLDVQIAPDGEIVLHGPVCLGAIGGPRAPEPFPTGDIGRIDQGGRLWIDGRKNSLIVTSYGRNLSPEWMEEALLSQPAVAQAMVYGDGLPAPEALLVPAWPEADLAVAVKRANAGLPPYARIGAWREVSPFTAGNGQLTANGRLCRKAISAAHLPDHAPFFDQLEAATSSHRMRFLQVPQVQAGLAGAIGLETYLAYLAQAYHHVSHTVPLMKEARARLGHRPGLVDALDDYIAEETGHEEWILADIGAAGGDPAKVRGSRPAKATRAMIDHAYDRIRNANPVSFFGMVYVLESVSVALAQRGASAVARNLGLPPEAFTYLTSHGALDQDHMRFFAQLANTIADRGDRAAITAMAQDIFGLFGDVFASIPLVPSHVPA